MLLPTAHSILEHQLTISLDELAKDLDYFHFDVTHFKGG